MSLVDRDSQLSQLTQLFSSCQHGQGAIAVVSGPVAVGKSQLLYTFAGQVIQDGAVALCANGSLGESSLPLGMLGQLLQNAATPADDAAPRFDESLSSVLPALEAGEQECVRAMERVRTALLDVAQDRPMIIGIDDVHDADVLSLQCLLYFVRRIRSARVLVILTSTESRLERSTPFIELLRLPHCHRIRLSPLSEYGVATAISEHLDSRMAEKRASAWRRASGGNPLLLRALIDDSQAQEEAATGPEAGYPTAGRSYRQAVLSCLRREESVMLTVAQGLAILGEDWSPKLVGELTGMDPISVTESIHALEAAGLLDAGRFPHPHARTAVLASLTPEDRARMHLEASRSLYDSGATAITVARHIIAAGDAPESWTSPVLREAGRHALTVDRPELAVECLELADQVTCGGSESATIKALLTAAEWRIDPVRGLRHLPAFVEAMRTGTLKNRYIVVVIRLLLWHGSLDEVVAMLEQLREQADQPRTAGVLPAIRDWLRVLAPPLLPHLETAVSPAGRIPRPRSLTASAEAAAATAMRSVLRDGASDEAVSRAEQALESLRLDDAALEPILTSLLALVYADELDKATTWCDDFLAEALEREAPTWQAQLGAVRAEIAMRRGDLLAADRHAWSALEQMSSAAWGVGIGLPLAGLIQASSALGKDEEAQLALGTPTPEALLKSRYGLNYLYARGRHHFAAGRFRAALGDFQTCGELMVAWDMDLPAFIPWRSEAAAACLRVGNQARARQLVLAQMERLGGDRGRMRGITLRLLAATSELKDRTALLRESVDILNDCGDHYELAHSLSDLSQAYQAMKQLSWARSTLRLAAQAARECHAESLLGTIVAASDPEPSQAEEAPAAEGGGTPLSDAERRVAALAARGDTNREIARRLYITVSTVEQHLTRVYRKLNVAGREDLAVKLHSAAPIANSA
jgi:DNA-binding CsgD family transcriptional regulator